MAFHLQSAIFNLQSRVRRWWLGRQWRLLLPGLPALVAGAAAVGLIGFAWAEGNRDVTARYLAEAKARARAGDHPAALTCYERLAGAGDGRPEVLYGLARASEAAGYLERAVVLMRGLAPEDERGYADAHLWWARHLLRHGGTSAKTLDLAERHLLNALDGQAEERDLAHGLLGELYLNRGQLDKAETHLRKGADSNPQLHLALARLYLTRGDERRGHASAEHAAKFFQSWTKIDLYAREGRLRLADARGLLGDYAGAVATLQEGLNATGDADYRRAISNVYAAWARHVAQTKKDSVGEQFALIEKALDADPNNTELVMRVWALVHAKGKEAEQALALLRKQLSSGKATALTHLALGMLAWESGKQAEALVHLEQGYKLSPGMGLVANNLAWVLANSQPPDLKRAKSLIDSVLDRWPGDPMFRDTRGFIHQRLGNWKDALSDYQAALPAYANTPDIHKRLAEVYAKLGLKEMAAEHTKRVEELQVQSKPGSSPPTTK
jgi:tetratricopeptide (TPR) repeat protein